MSLPTLRHTDRSALNKKRKQQRVYVITKLSINYIPSHAITQQFARYSYIRYNKIVIRGYTRNLFNESSEVVNGLHAIKNVTDLCRKYYHQKEDGIYQLGFKIYSALRTLKQPIVTEEMLKVVVMKHLRLKKRHYKTVIGYVNELVKLDYIIAVKAFEKKSVLYKFTVHAHMIFGKHFNISK
eukprot:853291_1